VEVIAADEGMGIESPTDAFRGAPTFVDAAEPRASLGVGLAATMELADELDVDVRIGEGTCLWARKFAVPPLTRRQIGIYGRPYPGEKVSGDHAGFLFRQDELVVGVADGLGHGEPAREASSLAIASLRRHADFGLEETLKRAQLELADTRGAVVAFGNIADATQMAEATCVGNVSFQLYGDGRCRTASGVTYILGDARAARKPVTERFQLGPRDKVVVFTDGLFSRTNIESDHALLREHPIIIAHQLVERFGRRDDDALVLVAG
jgi:hypothetical protein